MKKKLLFILLVFTILLVGCGKNKDDKTLGTISINESNDSISENNIPDILDEKYLEEGEQDIYIYFENRDLIVEPDFMPTKANTIIAEETQFFLESMGYDDIEYLNVIDSTVKKVSSISSFDSIMNGTGDILSVEYSAVTNEFSFSIKMQVQ